MIKHEAIYKLYPQVVTIIGDDAFDAQFSPVAYSEDAVQAKMIELQQAIEANKASAISKLTALGLSADEIKALTGVQA